MAGKLLINLLSSKCHHLAPCGILYRPLTSFQRGESLFTRLSPEAVSPKTDHRIAGRKYLPGSDGKGLPEFLRKPREDFPHALQAITADQLSIKQWAQTCSQLIDERLPKYGALLLRDLPLYTSKDFSEFSEGLGYRSMEYIGGVANRKGVSDTENVYTANDDPPDCTIEMHNEMAYHSTYPKKVIFYCLQQPDAESGGFTVICDSSEFVKGLDPEVIKKLEEKQVRYAHHFPDESQTTLITPTWQQVFETRYPEEVERLLEKQGWSYSWDTKLNRLSYWYTLPSFISHPDTGEKVWFNQSNIANISALKAHPLYQKEETFDSMYVYDTAYGDGSAIEPEVLQHIRASMWHSTVGFEWRNKDVLVLDNLTVLHGRLGFIGERKILANLKAD